MATSVRRGAAVAFVRRPDINDLVNAVKLYLWSRLFVANIYRLRNILFILTLLRWTRTCYFQLRGVGIPGTISVSLTTILDPRTD